MTEDDNDYAYIQSRLEPIIEACLEKIARLIHYEYLDVDAARAIAFDQYFNEKP